MKQSVLLASLFTAAAFAAEVCDTIVAIKHHPEKKGRFQLWENGGKKITYLHSLGAVKNGIIYGNQMNDDDAVVIIDANPTFPVDGKWSDPKTLGTIARPGSNVQANLPMQLRGDTLIFTDSTALRACNVANAASPAEIWTKQFPVEISRINWSASDTFYVADSSNVSSKGFHTSLYNGSTPPVILSSFGSMHIGLSSYMMNDRYIRVTTSKIATWKKPFTDRGLDSSLVTASLISGDTYTPNITTAVSQGNYTYLSTSDKGVLVYDHTKMSTPTIIDTLTGGGTNMLIYCFAGQI